jgi:hypothetical protein
MTDILHQKAFEIHALEASRVSDTSFVLAAFVCSIMHIMKEKTELPARSDGVNTAGVRREMAELLGNCANQVHLRGDILLYMQNAFCN